MRRTVVHGRAPIGRRWAPFPPWGPMGQPTGQNQPMQQFVPLIPAAPMAPATERRRTPPRIRRTGLEGPADLGTASARRQVSAAGSCGRVLVGARDWAAAGNLRPGCKPTASRPPDLASAKFRRIPGRWDLNASCIPLDGTDWYQGTRFSSPPGCRGTVHGRTVPQFQCSQYRCRDIVGSGSRPKRNWLRFQQEITKTGRPMLKTAAGTRRRFPSILSGQ